MASHHNTNTPSGPVMSPVLLSINFMSYTVRHEYYKWMKQLQKHIFVVHSFPIPFVHHHLPAAHRSVQHGETEVHEGQCSEMENAISMQLSILSTTKA